MPKDGRSNASQKYLHVRHQMRFFFLFRSGEREKRSCTERILFALSDYIPSSWNVFTISSRRSFTQHICRCRPEAESDILPENLRTKNRLLLSSKSATRDITIHVRQSNFSQQVRNLSRGNTVFQHNLLHTNSNSDLSRRMPFANFLSS